MVNWTLDEIKFRYRNYVRGNEFYYMNQLLRDTILDNNPKSVFEFGCNTGFNLQQIKDADQTVKVFGMDLSSQAVAQGIKNGLEIYLGDENTLLNYANSKLENDTYFPCDIAFTCSVLCHIPPKDLHKIISALRIIADKKVILLECDSEHDTEWYDHDYSEYGFNKFASVLSPDKRNYNFWEYTHHG